MADEDQVEVVGAVEPRRLDSVTSMRLDTDTLSTLRMRAEARGLTTSDLLRAGAEIVAAMTGVELDRALVCPKCNGTGLRAGRAEQKPVISGGSEGTPE